MDCDRVAWVSAPNFQGDKHLVNIGASDQRYLLYLHKWLKLTHQQWYDLRRILGPGSGTGSGTGCGADC